MNSLPVNTFKKELAAGKTLIGLWANFACLPTVEAVAYSGFDWVLLDMEHTPNDLQILGTQLLALRAANGQGSNTATIVRVPVADMATIKRALDTGSPNLMVPNVRNAAEARDVVSWTRFAPEGLRGVAGSTRGGGYTRYKDYMARANDEVGLVLQIESQEALDELDAICRIPGVDAVFIGPSDLAAALGHRGNIGHADVQAAISKAINVAKAAGTPIGILVVDGTAGKYIAQGVTMAGVGSDLHLLVKAADELAAQFAQKAG
ncbi:4-hydroxy-2-oxoheptanedioate aldolase [soil metagenome]